MRYMFHYIRILTGAVLFMSFPFLLMNEMSLESYLSLLAVNFILSYVSHKVYPDDNLFD